MNLFYALTIGCDLFLDLKLYRIPESVFEKLEKNFPTIKLVEFNTPTAESIDPATIDIYWGNRITKNLIHELTSLKWIHFGSVGVQAAMTKVVKEKNIRVSNSRGIMTDAVVSTGLAFIFALARGFHRSWKLRVKDQFDRKSFDSYFEEVRDVFGQSILIAGFGEIGKKLAQSCNALGLNVSIIKKNLKNIPQWVKNAFSINELEIAVKDADFIVDLLPLSDETTAVFSAKVFDQMKPTSFFINLGRGDTVIEDDLVDALEKRVIAGAGLDVFSSTRYVNPSVPLHPDSPLFGLDNVILTPHVAGLTNHYWVKECVLFFENLQRFCDNKELINEIFIEEFLSV